VVVVVVVVVFTLMGLGFRVGRRRFSEMWCRGDGWWVVVRLSGDK